jgi:NAD(P)-dependent dehydrogenase (short-subunit alcohol dehydrogenase family)
MTTATTTRPTAREPELLGQTVVLIGGSSGIGFETARRARVEGAEVILTGLIPSASSNQPASSVQSTPPSRARPTTSTAGSSSSSERAPAAGGRDQHRTSRR